MNIEQSNFGPPPEARRHQEQAYAFEEKDEFEKALSECEVIIQLAPGWAKAHNLLGIILEELDRHREARCLS